MEDAALLVALDSAVELGYVEPVSEPEFGPASAVGERPYFDSHTDLKHLLLQKILVADNLVQVEGRARYSGSCLIWSVDALETFECKTVVVVCTFDAVVDD